MCNKRPQIFFTLLIPCLALSSAHLVRGQTVATTPSGFYRIPCLGNSDTIVSFPFTRPVAAAGLVVGVAGDTLTINGAPPWSADQFVYSAGTQPNSYFILIHGGLREGCFYKVLGNGSATVTVDLGGDTLAEVAAGDRVVIIPYWTLGTAFPGGKGVHASPTAGNRQTEILIPNFDGTGINLSASRIFYYWDGAWREVGQGSTTKDDEILFSERYFVVRHNVSTDSSIGITGGVLMSRLAIPMKGNPTGEQDHVLALTRPATLSLNDSGLIASGGFRSSPTAGNRIDELFVFDNTVPVQNRSAAAIYYHWDGAWRQVGAGTSDQGNSLVFLPGTGIVIRRNSAAALVEWLNDPNY